MGNCNQHASNRKSALTLTTGSVNVESKSSKHFSGQSVQYPNKHISGQSQQLYHTYTTEFDAAEFKTSSPQSPDEDFVLSPLELLTNRVSNLVLPSPQSQSPTPLLLNSHQSKRHSRVTHHPLAHEHVRDVMCHVLGQKKDQDRAVCVPALLPGLLFAGVFDGHGRNGEIRSELATSELPRLLKEALEKVHTIEFKEHDLYTAFDHAYTSFHTQLDQLYQETVFNQAVALARQNSGRSEINENEVRMPQDGGTTATSVLVSGELIVLGWVGDSRAVLCRRIAKKRGPILNRFSSRLKIATLTEDHNVATNISEEMKRVEERGGEIYGKHLTFPSKSEGMLQLTRSLGDSPFHRTGLVVSKPGLITIPVFDESVDPLLFLLVASDGLWDYFGNREAISFVYKMLKKNGYASKSLSSEERGKLLADTARALEMEAVKKSQERKSHSDDITVLIITFTKGWDIEAEDTPSF